MRVVVSTTQSSALTALLVCCFHAALAQTAVAPQSMKVIGEVDPRYVSYNVETVEVTGGRFWAPYKSKGQEPPPTAAGKNQPAGLDPSLFQYRAPINLANPKLRKLAAALAPAYIRVSGTWRNSTYFQDNDDPPMKTPPAGFAGVLTRAQWKGVIDFSHATGTEIVTSVATSIGTRDASGVWTPTQAKAWLDYTKRIGGHIAATEFMNEPTFPATGAAPAGYDAKMFAEDVKTFRSFLQMESPKTVFLGPGSVGEGISLTPPGMPGPKMIATEDMLKASGPIFDAFSYHFYPTVSSRCLGPLAAKFGMHQDDLLKPDWFDRNKVVERFYADLRDRYMPGKDLWLTETGEAGCGGDKWSSTFVDTFRYIDQLGSLAQHGVKTVMQNTLASSDYGLLDEDTLEPRPNYWAALMWKRTMGTTVLDPKSNASAPLRFYAQCAKDLKGGVTLAVLNTDEKEAHALQISASAQRYTLSSPDLFSRITLLNGVQLAANQNGELPRLKPQVAEAGNVVFAPLTITFLVMQAAANRSCM
jgi:heparanase 1